MKRSTDFAGNPLKRLAILRGWIKHDSLSQDQVQRVARLRGVLRDAYPMTMEGWIDGFALCPVLTVPAGDLDYVVSLDTTLAVSQGIKEITTTLWEALLLVILVNALLSWVRPDPHHPLVQLLERISDFVCDPIRRLFPTTVGGIDFAPFIAMLLIVFLQRFAIASLRDVALRMG